MLSVNTLDKLSRTGEIIFLFPFFFFFLKSLILSTMCKITENSKGTVWNTIYKIFLKVPAYMQGYIDEYYIDEY